MIVAGRLALCLLPILLVLVCCGGSSETPTPIIIVVTSAPQQSETANTEAATPMPPTAEPPTPEPDSGLEVLGVTFAHGLSEEMQPVDPGSDFAPDETIYLSVEIKGRPKEGIVTARFYWHEDLIAEAGVDIADVNSGLIFSIGQNTFAGYDLNHEQPFPVSDKYYTEIWDNGELLLGTYPFRVVPPAEAIPSQVRDVVLAKGADENYQPIEPATTFDFGEVVHLVGQGDLGISSWIQAEWYVAGQLDEAGTRSLTMEENLPETGFSFSYIPEGGWPVGEHYVILTMDDQELGSYAFTTTSDGGAAPIDETAFWETFPLPNDAEIVPVVEGYDYGFATTMTEPEVFDAYAAWLLEQGWQQQAPTEAMVTLPHQTWRKDGAEFLIEIQGLDEQSRTVVWVNLEVAAE